MKQVKKIGIVGGGQLARMMVEPATRLGFDVTVIDPTPDCPAAQVGARQIVADYKDALAIEALSDETDVITIDFEHVNTHVLRKLADSGKNIQPTPETIAMIQDKLKQCDFLSRHGLPLADFEQINSLDQAGELLDKYGGQMMLKKRRHSYDGKGNTIIGSRDELNKAWRSFGSEELYGEKLVDFAKELSVVFARDMSGNIAIYPVVETIHINNICHEVFLPASIDEQLKETSRDLAVRTAQHLKGAGVFAIEMFLDSDGEILINEIAPRVHNSGHPTIEGCATSQFEQHIRAITGMELGPVDMKVPAATMINILGQRNGQAKPEGIEEAEQIDGVKVHIYGKQDIKTGRKMGHITAVADTLEEATAKAEQAHLIVKI